MKIKPIEIKLKNNRILEIYNGNILTYSVKCYTYDIVGVHIKKDVELTIFAVDNIYYSKFDNNKVLLIIELLNNDNVLFIIIDQHGEILVRDILSKMDKLIQGLILTLKKE